MSVTRGQRAKRKRSSDVKLRKTTPYSFSNDLTTVLHYGTHAPVSNWQPSEQKRVPPPANP
jgi:hypothetical protein